MDITKNYIHPIWIVCIITRFAISKYIDKPPKNIALFALLIIAFGFIYKYFTGSNNETQISKVFWHESRFAHGILYLIAVFYLYTDNIKLTSKVLLLDLVFSFIYRFL